jgi:hypothetical protein
VRRLLIIGIALVGHSCSLFSQELPAIITQQLEENVNEEEEEMGNDGYFQDLEHYKRHPLNLNTAGRDDLTALAILNQWQIENLLAHRRLLGKLINLYELQAVPGWDLITIRKIWPFVSVIDPLFSNQEFSKRITKGEHTVLFRVSQVLEEAQGFKKDTGASHFLGSPQKVFARYRFKYKDLLQYGVTAEKDAGEPLLQRELKGGFDFYSFHLFIRKLGRIAALALGDFTVSLGQGLIHWQSMALRMGSPVLNIKRESAVLKPYGSAGEFNFHRGAGLTLYRGRWEGTGFISVRKLSSTIAGEENYFSSFQASGYHRTRGELDDRNNLGQLAAGGNISFRDERTHIGVNAIYHRFAMPLQKKKEPYNLYAVQGRQWYNGSVDYAYTGKNFHAFGEFAVDGNRHIALINGIVMSVDRKADLAILHRTLGKKYQAINGNAFTENTTPSNENGLYAGFSISPLPGWLLNAWVDIYQFPWMKFGVDHPSQGINSLFRLNYIPDRRTEIYLIYRSRREEVIKQSLRLHISQVVSEFITVRNRYELTWMDQVYEKEEGFLTFVDIVCKPVMKPFSFILRWLFFETSSYASRIYAYENDVLFSYTVPAFAGRGKHYGVLLSYDISKRVSGWVHWQQTDYPGQMSIGSGPAEIKGSKKSEIKIQFLLKL